MLTSWGFIYLEPGADPAGERIVRDTDGLRTTIVAVPDETAAVQAAVALVDDDAQLIELCGIFGPIWAARVIEAVDGRVPVGAVGYGVESVLRLAARITPVAQAE